MAEIKGIDVSRCQGNINWKTVADYGMGFAILRITEKGNIIDSTFERNYKGCVENNIPVGVYKYSYATTVAQMKEEANVVVKTLNKRVLNYPVFLDIEDKCQENLSQDLMMKMIDSFKDIVTKAGYKFGIYCGYHWYKTKLPEGAKKYDCWLAAYPASDNGTLQERLRPTEGIGWQYSSCATILGIPTKVDRNVFYKDYAKEGGNSMSNTNEKAIDALIKIAEQEIGYLEKKSNSQLDDKTANAGNANYTKYWRDLKPSWNGSAWCAVFVSWCMVQAFGMETAKKLLKHESDFPYVYCPTLGARFTKYSDPQKGDVVIFYRNGEFAHTGIVIKVEGDKFWTIEGNTSGGSTIIANGGGVCKKSYYNSQLPGTKFCRPDYSIVKSINSSNNTSSTPSVSSSKALIKQAQKELNNFVGTNLVVDGIAGQATKTAFRKTIQKALNKDYKAGLVEDGIIGEKTNAILKKACVKKGSKGYMVSAVEIGMLLNGFDPKGVEYPGSFGSGLDSAVKEYQLSKGLDGKGIVAKKTFAKLVE